jgi:hypothetical protein
LAVIGAQPPLAPPESVGALLDLLPQLAAQAFRIPLSVSSQSSAAPGQPTSHHRHLERVLSHRDRWLRLMAATIDDARVAAHAGSPAATLTSDDLAKLSLLQHAIGTILASSGDTQFGPLPVPLQASPWLAVRWRVVSGAHPGSTDLPPMPMPEGPIDAAWTLLARHLDLTPLAAVGLRREIIDLMQRRDELLPFGQEREERRRAIEDELAIICDTALAPERERLLCRALIALRLGQERLVLQARASLVDSGAITTDPLALALHGLLGKRYPAMLSNLPRFDASSLAKLRGDVQRWFPEFQGLMDGTADATARIWRARMPYAQAMAIALAMQELLSDNDPSDTGPAWDLLDRVPGHTLPLLLLAPPRITAPATSGAVIAPSPGGPPVVP